MSPDLIFLLTLGFRMAITARHTPVSIVWHALGYERACLLPGRMGNMLLRPSEVAAALEQTRRAYAGTSPQELHFLISSLPSAAASQNGWVSTLGTGAGILRVCCPSAICPTPVP